MRTLAQNSSHTDPYPPSRRHPLGRAWTRPPGWPRNRHPSVARPVSGPGPGTSHMVPALGFHLRGLGGSGERYWFTSRRLKCTGPTHSVNGARHRVPNIRNHASASSIMACSAGAALPVRGNPVSEGRRPGARSSRGAREAYGYTAPACPLARGRSFRTLPIPRPGSPEPSAAPRVAASAARAVRSRPSLPTCCTAALIPDETPARGPRPDDRCFSTQHVRRLVVTARSVVADEGIDLWQPSRRLAHVELASDNVRDQAGAVFSYVFDLVTTVRDGRPHIVRPIPRRSTVPARARCCP